MKFSAEIDIMPLKDLLDPQGKAVTAALAGMGMEKISGVRLGKHISCEVEAGDIKSAEILVDKACKEMLHNPVVEYYTFRITEA